MHLDLFRQLIIPWGVSRVITVVYQVYNSQVAQLHTACYRIPMTFTVGNLEKASEGGTWVRISAQSHELLGFFFSHHAQQVVVDNDYFVVGYTKFDSKADEGK